MKQITVGLIIPQYKDMFSTFYTMEIIQGVSKGALSAEVDLLVHIAHKFRPKEDEIGLKIFNSHVVNGLLFADIMGNEELIERAKKRRIPYVVLNYFDKDSKDNCIGVDNKSAAREVIDYLVRMGHERIATVTGKLQAQAGSGRLLGYKEGLEANGIKLNNDYIIKGDWAKDSGRKAMDSILRLEPSPTAVFVAGDEMAIGLMEEARLKGVNIPDNLSVVGFDDIPLVSSSMISLTTVRQPLYEVGRLGLKYLKGILEGKVQEPVKVFLNNTQIIVRNTVKNLP